MFCICPHIVRTCFVTTFERSKRFEDNSSGETTIKPCPDVEYPIRGQQVITVPGRLRETAFEVLFPNDSERAGLPHLVLKSILKCPVDIRRELAENVLLIGGTAMAVGLMARLKDELLSLVRSELYKQQLFIGAFKFHTAPSKANFTGWLGGKEIYANA